MKLLKELLNELYQSALLPAGSRAGQQRHGEEIWRQQAATAEQEHWIITKQGRKYGPFPTRDKALGFMQARLDIPRDSALKAISKGSRI